MSWLGAILKAAFSRAPEPVKTGIQATVSRALQDHERAYARVQRALCFELHGEACHCADIPTVTPKETPL